MNFFGLSLRARSCARLFVAINSLLLWPSSVQAGWFEQVGRLRPDEAKFIRAVLAGDEEAAMALAQTGRINPNQLAGQPLSGWFYSGILGGKGLIDPNVHRIVFQTFRQGPNPPNIGLGDGAICKQAPSFKWDEEIAKSGTPEQKKSQIDRWQAEWRELHSKIASSFQSLLRYGLRDRQIITAMFQGCFFDNPIASDERYDMVIRPMIKAGANINAPNYEGQPPIERAISLPQISILSRLLEDGARTDVPAVWYGPPGQREDMGCTPRLERSVFKHLFLAQEHYRLWKESRPNDPMLSQRKKNILTVVELLSKAGFSPMREYGSRSESGLDTECRRITLYGEIAKTDGPFAEEVKSVALLNSKTSAASPPPVAAAAPIPRAAASVTIDSWRVSTRGDGRDYATVTSTSTNKGKGLKELQIECAPSGNLEFVLLPYGNERMASLIPEEFDGAPEVKPFKAVNNRIAAPESVRLMKLLLAEDNNARKSGAANSWTFVFFIDNPQATGYSADMGGLTKVRQHLLQRCKAASAAKQATTPASAN